MRTLDAIGMGIKLCAPAGESSAGAPLPPSNAIPASTVTHVIKHKSFWAALAGAIVGAIIGAVLVVGAIAIIGATGGAALAVGIAAGAAIGFSPVGGAIGAISQGVTNFFDNIGPGDGAIGSGSPNVLIEGLAAARVQADGVICGKHPGMPPIADGSGNVLINDCAAVRKGDKDSCGCEIKQGAKSVMIGGGTKRYLDVADDFTFMEKVILFAVDVLVPPSGRSLGKLLSKSGKLVGSAVRGAGKLASSAARGSAKIAKGAAGKAKAFVSKKGAGKSKNCRKECGDPIDVVTGSVVDQRVDLTLGQTLPLRFERYYNSESSGWSHLGPGWFDSWGEHLAITRSEEGREIDYNTADELTIPFQIPLAYKAGTHENYPNLELHVIDDGYLLYDSLVQTTREFKVFTTGMALLTLEVDAHGNTIHYNRDKQGLLTHIHHSDGIDLRIEHDDQGRLTRISRQLDKQSYPLAEYTYDQGYLIEANVRAGYHLSYQYNERGLMAQWRDTQHTWARYIYDDQGRCVRNTCSGDYYNTVFRYDENARVTISINNKGEATEYRYNDNELVTHITNHLGETIETVYDDRQRVIAEIDPMGRRTEYNFDEASGKIATRTDPQGHAVQIEYDGKHRLVSTANAMGDRWQYEYNYAGDPIATTSPLGHKTLYGYTETGQLILITSAEGRKTQFTYDTQHRLVTRTDCDNNSEHYRYNALDQLTEYRDQSGHATHYTYNKNERLSKIQHANGSEQSFAYDNEHNPVQQINAEGHSRHVVYGPFDLLVTQLDAHNQPYKFDYDLDHLKVTQVTNPVGDVYRYRYDPAGRVVEERDYSGRSTDYEYDPAGQLIRKTNPMGETIVYQYDDSGQLISEQASGEKTPRQYEYDVLGRLIKATTHNSSLELAYDADGRVIQESSHEGLIKYEYDADGFRLARHIHSYHEQPIHTTRYEYDARGHLERLKLPGTSPLAFNFDQRGLPVEQRNVDGFHLSQSFNDMGLLEQQAAGQSAKHTPMPFSPLATASNNDIPTSQHTPQNAQLDRHYQYNMGGNLKNVDDKYWGGTRYQYDANDQVVETRGENGFNERFSYEKGGRQLAQAERHNTGSSIHSAWSDKGQWQYRQTAGLVKQRGHTRYEYDSTGRLVTKREQKPGFRPKLWQYKWNAWDQLSHVKTPEGQVWEYTYDVLGRRVNKHNRHSGQWLSTLWDGDVIAREEQGHLGVDSVTKKPVIDIDTTEYWTFAPNSFVPIAKQSLQKHSAAYIETYQERHGKAPPIEYPTWYVVNDHIGTPKALFNDQGQLAWRGEHAVWGQLISADTDADSLSDIQTNCPLRFQGQYFDKESGLHYNRFRYYDPEVAQYISPDPIGLAGGLAPQAYVHNPNAWVDPLGLAGHGGVQKGPLKNASGNLDDAARAARTQPHYTPNRPHFSGTNKPLTSGATPNSKYTHIGSDGKAVQNAIYNGNGKVVGHVDFKRHGPGPEGASGHGHKFPEPGNPGSGHGRGKPHIPNDQLPSGWSNLPPGVSPRTPIGQ